VEVVLSLGQAKWLFSAHFVKLTGAMDSLIIFAGLPSSPMSQNRVHANFVGSGPVLQRHRKAPSHIRFGEKSLAVNIA